MNAFHTAGKKQVWLAGLTKCLNVLIIFLLLFSALGVQTASAEGSHYAVDDSPLAKNTKPVHRDAKSEYARSSSRMGVQNKELSNAIKSPAFVSEYGADLQCVQGTLSAFPCPSNDIGPVWTGSVTYESGPALSQRSYMKILCTGWGCPKRDIYYQTTIVYAWASSYNRTVKVGANVKAYFGTAEGAISNIPCGTGKAGSCTITASGVLRAGLIASDPNANDHFTFSRAISGIGTGDYLVQTWKMEAALDPSLLTNNVEGLSVYSLSCEGDCPTSNFSGTQGTIGDPINTQTGGMDYPVEDLAFQTSAGQLAFQRSYSSKAVDQYTAPLGYGWTHNLDTRLIFPTDPGGKAGYVYFKAHSANLYRFYVYGDGRFSPVPGVMGSLVRNPGPPVTYTLQTESQNTYLFNETGKLLTWTDPKGHSLTYSYDANNRLDLVTADGGSRYLDLGYDAQGRLATVTDHAGRSVSFGYDASGDLASAVDVMGGTWQYIYGPKHELTEVIDPQGNTVVRTEFEESTAEPLDFNNLVITSFAAEDVNSTMAIEDGGATLHITGNGWKKVEIPYTITDKTILEFDFRSPAQGEVHGIGYDNDNVLSEKRTFKLYGTQNYGLTTFNNYAGSAPNWKHYRIPLGQYYSGDALYLFFANDHDITTPTAQSYFSNVRLYEDNGLRAVRQYEGEDNLVVEITYNTDGTTILTDALGNETVHTYDNRRTLTGETNPTGADMSKTYDPHFRPSSITDPLDHTKTFVWSPDGANLTKVVDAEGNQTDIGYDAANNITSITDPQTHQTTFAYFGKLLLSTTNALDKTTFFTYTPEGYLESVVDPLTHTTSYTYDSHGQVLSMTDPLDHTWFYSYDSLGNLVDTTDPLGHVTHNEYDDAGRLVKVTQNFNIDKIMNEDNVWNIVTEYGYNVRGNLLSVTDTYERVTHYEYDSADRLVKTIDPAGHEIANTYNEAGQLVSTTDALNRTTQYVYDDASRLVTTIDALGHTTSLTYNPDGTVATRTDANNIVKRYEYNSVKWLTAVVENFRPGFLPDQETNVTTEYDYDDNGNLILIRDANLHETHFTYDALNRLAFKSDAIGNEWEYSYNEVNQLVAITDAKNETTQFTYDANGQLTLIDYPAPDADVSFTYDTLGRRVEMQDGIGTTTWEYDELSRALSITDPFDNVVSYEYDALGNQTALHYPDGKTAEYTYNLNNLLTGVTDWNNADTTYTYDNASQLRTVSRPNGVNTTYDYDNAGRLLSIIHEKDLETLASYLYEYDNVGNRTQAIESVLQPDLPEGLMQLSIPEEIQPETPTPTATLEDTATPTLEPTIEPTVEPTLTPMPEETLTPTPEPTLTPTETAAPTPNAFVPDFLQVAYHPPQALRFQSDFNPARLQQTLDQVIDYDYDPLYRLTAADYSTGDYFHYTYDNVGNRLTQAKSINGVQSSDTYLYNVANQLSSVNGVTFTWDLNGNLTSDGVNTYTYDHADRLTAVQNQTTTIENSYNGLGDRVQQSVNSLTTNFTLDINNPLTQVLADGTNTYLYGLDRIAQSSLIIEYFLTDALGSARQMVDAGGAVQSAVSFEPFGAQLTDGAFSYGFAGEWQDSYIKLIFLRSRYYSPLTGTFISRDSWQGDYNRPLSLNRWTYVNGNPVNYTDPSGLFSSPYASFRGNSFREVDKIQIHYALVEVAKAYRRGYLEYLAYLDNYYSNIGCITSDLESIKYWLSLQFPTNSDTTIFLRIHSGPILFNEDGQDLGWWATTHSKNQINIHKGGFLSKYTTYQELDGTILYASRYEDFLSGKTVPGFDMQNWIDVTERYRHWVTHEVGHAFNNAIKDSSGAGKLPENTVTKWQNANKLPLPLSPYDEEGGFCGTKNEGWQWRLSDQNGPGEIFSDMFIGWVYNCFESSQRSDFMNENMPYWIFNAAKP